MSAEAFLDTNLLVYALASNDPRADVADAILQRGGVISVQVLNEFVAVTRGKLKMSWPDVTEALDIIGAVCDEPAPVTMDTHALALELAQAHNCNIYDGLIVAAALRAGCTTLYSEDFQDGAVFRGKLTVRNPFA